MSTRLRHQSSAMEIMLANSEPAEELRNETPPPDPDDFMAARASGLRAIGHRWEMLRRNRQESK